MKNRKQFFSIAFGNLLVACRTLSLPSRSTIAGSVAVDLCGREFCDGVHQKQAAEVIRARSVSE